MNYIVLDLEWNQSNTGDEEEVKQIPFEIIDFGAIKLNNRDEMIDEFNQLVKPQVYQHMHHITSKIIHLMCRRGLRLPRYWVFRVWIGSIAWAETRFSS